MEMLPLLFLMAVTRVWKKKIIGKRSNTTSTASIRHKKTSSCSGGNDKKNTTATAVLIEDDDDPGQDHALPSDECTGSLTPSNVWKSQNQQSTCEFTHTITHYSQKRESGCKKAEYSGTTIDHYGNRWRLIVYVNGNGRASNHHLSLFLQVADADELPFGWKKAVSYVLTLEHPSGSNLGYAKRNPDKTFKLCPKAIDWGWSQFITSDRIQQEGYVHNDSLTVRASVTVKSSSVSIDAEDAELYLKCAVEEGNADAVKICLSQGAGVNCQFKDDLYTPLHTACSSSSSTGSLEVLKLLLETGADGNACNKWRETPLLIAANNGHRAAVEALLEHGADPSLCSEAGWSALTFAAHKGYDDIVSLLLTAGAPVNCKVTEDLSTPLHKACAGGKPGHLSAVRQLLQGGANVHALNKWRETPLLTAANHGQAAAVEALLRAGGDPCKCTDTGWSPLSIAAYKGHDDVVRLLLEEGAPTEEADPTLSALLQAATKGLPDTVELLLQHGADHTVTTKKGDTALSILVEQNLIDAAVEMVTEYKASVPRCSRDRKKVQRARLLINLRVKQQREGILNGSMDDGETEEDDDSEQDEPDDNPNPALHPKSDAPVAAAPSSSKKKKKKSAKTKDRENAEAEAKAAETALLLELEKEEVEAQKEEAAATSKRNKKKKKRERERQQKLREESLKEEKEKKELERKKAEEKKKLLHQQQLEEAEKLAREREEKEKELLRKKEALEIGRQKKRLQEQLERDRKEADREKALSAKKKDDREKKKEKKERNLASAMNKKSPCTTAAPINDNPSSSSNLPYHPASKKKDLTKLKIAGALKKSSMSFVLSSKNDTATLQDSSKAKNYNPTRASHSNGGVNKALDTSTTPVKKRGWETKTAQPTVASISSVTKNAQQSLSSPSPMSRKQQEAPIVQRPQEPAFSVEDELENMANGVVDFLGFDCSPPAPALSTSSEVAFNNVPKDYVFASNEALKNSVFVPDRQHLQHQVGNDCFLHCPIELPAVAIFQQKKVDELLRAATKMGLVSDSTLRSVIHRYIIRASHACAEHLDPVIPSWTDTSFLEAFLQRQLIAENRRHAAYVSTNNGSGGATRIVRMEILKEAGSSLTNLCVGLAKDISRFRSDLICQVSHDWTDDVVGIRVHGRHANTIVVLECSGSQVSVSSKTFSALRERYCGPQHQFLSAMFTMAKRYETKRLIGGFSLDYRLTSATIKHLCMEACVTVEASTDPLSVYGNNIFSGAFSDVDAPFGGRLPFGKEGGGGELLLLEKGGSVVVIPPLESATAYLYLRCMVDLLERTESANIPLSFAVFLPSQCFREPTFHPSISDLCSLDSRLGEHQSRFVRSVKSLSEDQHMYYVGEGDKVNSSGILFALLQNDGGKQHYPVSDLTAEKIVRSLSLKFSPLKNDLPLSPSGHDTVNLGASDIFQVQQYNNSSDNFRSRRVFELEDNGEDETLHEVDVIPGIYAGIISAFENDSNVDIDNLALYGIGGGVKGGAI